MIYICQQCQNFTNPNSTLSQWPTAPHNIFRVHIDFFEEMWVYFFVVADQKSKWIEVILMKNDTNAAETIFELKNIFAI